MLQPKVYARLSPVYCVVVHVGAGRTSVLGSDVCPALWLCIQIGNHPPRRPPLFGPSIAGHLTPRYDSSSSIATVTNLTWRSHVVHHDINILDSDERGKSRYHWRKTFSWPDKDITTEQQR